MLYKVVLTFESEDEVPKCGRSIQIKVTDQYFPVTIIIMLIGYEENTGCCCGTVYYAVQVRLYYLLSLWMSPKVWPIDSCKSY